MVEWLPEEVSHGHRRRAARGAHRGCDSGNLRTRFRVAHAGGMVCPALEFYS